jgi:DNA recombination protein RmuC
MFLPTESLYIEAVEMGLFEACQSEFKIILCGPSTVCANINALKLGFNSVEIQKRSNEVFKLLGTIKTEFDKFAKALYSTQARFVQLEKDLDELVGKRTRIMQRKLENVASLDGDADFELE